MLIYGAILIPIFASVYLLMFHRKDSKAWEFLVIFAVAIVCIVVPKAISESSQVHAIEFWGHVSSGIIHKEPYSYMSTCQEACGET